MYESLRALPSYQHMLLPLCYHTSLQQRTYCCTAAQQLLYYSFALYAAVLALYHWYVQKVLFKFDKITRLSFTRKSCATGVSKSTAVDTAVVETTAFKTQHVRAVGAGHAQQNTSRSSWQRRPVLELLCIVKKLTGAYEKIPEYSPAGTHEVHNIPAGRVCILCVLVLCQHRYEVYEYDTWSDAQQMLYAVRPSLAIKKKRERGKLQQQKWGMKNKCTIPL